mmetsp:Transcript_54468/g.61620  ORF Transcript_54468/g.61620 Transcript_54468/m.61620 type:complete len:608 (+) Transcript_54468:14-1837(+)
MVVRFSDTANSINDGSSVNNNSNNNNNSNYTNKDDHGIDMLGSSKISNGNGNGNGNEEETGQRSENAIINVKRKKRLPVTPHPANPNGNAKKRNPGTDNIHAQTDACIAEEVESPNATMMTNASRHFEPSSSNGDKTMNDGDQNEEVGINIASKDRNQQDEERQEINDNNEIGIKSNNIVDDKNEEGEEGEEEEDHNNEQQLERKQNSSSSSTSTCGIDSSSPPREGEGDRTKYLLWKQDFRRPHSAMNRSVVVRTWVHPAMILLSILLAMVVIAGCILPTFSIEILGVIGVAVESGQQFEEAKTYHSVISIVAMLFEEAKFLDTPGDYIGLTVLSCLFLCTVLFIPIIQAMCLLVQWFLPLTRTQRTRMWVLNEILQAWQYMEVYLLALFVASWQLGPVSQYLFNSQCKNLRGFFAQLVSYEILKEEDAQCFGVQGAIEPGSFTLVAAAMLLALLNSFVTKATRQHNYYLERSLPDVDVEDVHVHEDVHADNDAENNSNNHHHDSSTTTVAPSTTTRSTKLRPIPVMFTDTYRWLLRGEGAAAAAAITTTTVDEVDTTHSMEAGRASLSTTADGKEGSFRNSRRLSPPSRTRNSRSSLPVEDVGVP